MAIPIPTTAAALTICGALLFGSKGVLIKLCYPHGVSPIAVLCLRLAVALPCFVALAWWERRRAGRPMTWGERSACALIGLLGYHQASWLDFEALALLSVGLERVILFSFPTFVVLLPALWYRRMPEPIVLACLAVTYAGITISYAGDIQGGPDTVLGVGLVLAAA
jgi:drug/metabolite transporter (DMT)-like permease